MSEMDKALTANYPNEELILHPPIIEAYLGIFDSTMDTLDRVITALDRDIYAETQAKALGDIADAAVLLACETYKVIDGAYDPYESGLEDGYDEAVCELFDDEDDWEDDGECADADQISLLDSEPTALYCEACNQIINSQDTTANLCPACSKPLVEYQSDETS
jgi:rubrerythrin